MAHRLPSAGKKSEETDHFMFYHVVGPEKHSPKKCTRRPSANESLCGMKAKAKPCCSKNPAPPLHCKPACVPTIPVYCKCCRCRCSQQSTSQPPPLEPRPSRLTAPPRQHSPGHRLACWPDANPNTCLCPETCERMMKEEEERLQLLQQQEQEQQQQQQGEEEKKGTKPSKKKKKDCQCAKKHMNYKIECTCKITPVPRQPC